MIRRPLCMSLGLVQQLEFNIKLGDTNGLMDMTKLARLERRLLLKLLLTVKMFAYTWHNKVNYSSASLCPLQVAAFKFANVEFLV